MATWLWVDGLASGQMNDWMPVSSFSGRWSHSQVVLTVTPGRLNPYLIQWVTKGTSKEVSVFFDPQTEYTLTEGFLASYSTSGSTGEVSLGISFRKISASYSGEP